MRIACISMPGFAQQVQVRGAPHLQGQAFVVLSGDPSGMLRVIACSRRAREHGVTVGMTAAQARTFSPRLVAVQHDPAAAHNALSAAADVLAPSCNTIEVDSAGQLFAEIPPAVRAPSWGHRVLAALTRHGFVARVGVADNRFTAWAATRVEPRQAIRIVAQGGAAKFLAPLSLNLLPLGPQMQRMYARVQIRSLGDFAALPPPSTGRAGAHKIRAWQALASGRDKSRLVAFEPAEVVRERIELVPAVSSLETLDFVLLPLVDRLVTRLRGRGQAPTKLRLTLSGSETCVIEAGDAKTIMSCPTALATLRAQLHEQTRASHAICAIEVSVLDHDQRSVEQRDLFQHVRDSAPPSRAPSRRHGQPAGTTQLSLRAAQ